MQFYCSFYVCMSKQSLGKQLAHILNTHSSPDFIMTCNSHRGTKSFNTGCGDFFDYFSKNMPLTQVIQITVSRECCCSKYVVVKDEKTSLLKQV